MRRLLLAVVLGVLPGLIGVAPAHADQASAVTCAGVWVVVDGGALDADVTGTRCATSFETGTDALGSAGFTVGRSSSGILCSINGRPDPCRATATAYWSYWQAARSSDGGYAPWTYASLGADSYQPRLGDAEGWAFGAGNPPAQRPPDGARASSPASASPASPGPPSPAPATAGPGDVALTFGLVLIGVLAVGAWWWMRRRRS